MFASEGYTSKASAMHAIAAIKEHAGAAETNDLTKAEKAPSKPVTGNAAPKAAKAETAA